LNNLVIIENNEQLISMRELYEALEIKSKFNDWKKRMFEYGYEENIDYILVTQKKVTNNPKNPITEYIDYYLKIDVAKEICMIQRNDKGREFRKYFIEVEKAYNDLQFRIGDKKHQLKCMEMLQDFLPEELKQEKVSYIKANTVVNKCTSNYFGFPKMLKKAEMNDEMLKIREKILDDYLKLFEVLQDNGEVKEVLYRKYDKRKLLLE
jgi:anti-repressor protein